MVYSLKIKYFFDFSKYVFRSKLHNILEMSVFFLIIYKKNTLDVRRFNNSGNLLET